METKIKILEDQIQALKDLLAIKDQTIKALQERPTQPTYVYHYNYQYPQYQQVQYPYQVYCGAVQGQLNHQQGQMYAGSTLQWQVGGGFQAGQGSNTGTNMATSGTIQTSGYMQVVKNHAHGE